MLLEDLKLNLRTARANARSRRETAPLKGLKASAPWQEFRSWRQSRPFVGTVLTILAGIEMFFSGQLDLGNIHVSVGIEGLQSTVIPVIMVTLGLLTMFMPQHRIFYGVISLAVSVYSLIGLNLGGFFVGMILGAVGGILMVSWMPRTATETDDAPASDRAENSKGQLPLVHSRS